jgi:cell division protein FtsA
MNSIENQTESAVKFEKSVPEKVSFQREKIIEPVQEVLQEVVQEVEKVEVESTETKIRRSFFEKYVDKIKDFLDNAE